MTVVVNDAVLTPFLRSSFGPVGQDLALRAFNVFELAQQNASGPVIGQRSKDLFNGIKIKPIEGDAIGLFAIIGTDARHGDFNYPAFHDQVTGRPWLTHALRDGFRFGRSS